MKGLNRNVRRSNCFIEGGHKLNGTVTISGAKNATVALIPSIVLSDEPVEIYNVPEISDVDALTVLLEELIVLLKEICP